MKTVLPSVLIRAASIHGRLYWIDREEYAGPRTQLRLYHKNGKPLCERWHGSAEWHQQTIHRGNIVEVGNPRLSAVWEKRAEAAHDALWERVAADMAKRAEAA